MADLVFPAHVLLYGEFLPVGGHELVHIGGEALFVADGGLHFLVCELAALVPVLVFFIENPKEIGIVGPEEH